MRFRPSHVAWLAAAALPATACNLIFGLNPGEANASGTTGGGPPDGGGPDADHDSGAGGTGGGTTCTAGTATCQGAILHACDGTGHPAAPVDCTIVAACDAAARKCLPADHFGRLAVGTGRSCVIEDDRTVRCWGQNSGGGLLLTDPHWMLPTAQPMPGIAGARQISVDGGQQCVLLDDGTVTCWGTNDTGELGIGSTGTKGPTMVPGISDAVEVGTAARCGCVRHAAGTVSCWGAEETGCMGVPSPKQQIDLPTQVPGVKDAVELKVGVYDTPTCVRQASGKVVCWNRDITPSEIPGVSDALQVAVGFGVVFVRSKASGVLWSTATPGKTWATATSYGLVGNIKAIAAGDAFVGLRDDGKVLYALLNGNNPPEVAQPMKNQPPGMVAEIAVGHSLGYDLGLQCLRLSGVPLASSVYCWGDDLGGALGANAPEIVRQPTDVPGVTAAASISTAQSSSFAVLADGSVVLWGTAYNFAGQPSPMPQTLGALGKNNVKMFNNDSEHAAYVTQKSGPTLFFEQGTAVPGTRLFSTGFTDYLAARDHSHFDVGLRSGGTVVIYAEVDDANTEGIFGDGTTAAMADHVVTVPGISTATAVAAYGDDYNPFPAHVCAILAGGTLSCWGGNNWGEVGVGIPGSGVTVNTPTQVSIPNGETIVSVAVGRGFTCAVSTPGKVYCWGSNDVGQLGSPNTMSFAVPLEVMNIANAKGITAREAHACAWLADGTVRCWGGNDSGQLGDGTLDNQDHPIAVPGLANVVEVSAGADHTCARRTDGTVACWGSSYDGQIGTGLVGLYSKPLQVLGL
jgi:alpha-tubulin suppressor-like RCC1 family protein